MFKNATFLSFYFADNQLFSNSETLVIKINEQIKRHIFEYILKIKIRFVQILQCKIHFWPAYLGVFPSQHPVQRIFPYRVFQ